MSGEDTLGRLVLQGAAAAGLGVVLVHLVPPRIADANAVAVDILGAGVDELRALSPFDLVAPEQRELAVERLKRHLAGENLTPFEITMVRPDGRRVDVFYRVGSCELEGQPAAVLFVSQHDRTTDLVADARFRQLVDAAPDGVAITRGPQFLYANQAARAMLCCNTTDELQQLTGADFLAAEDLQVMIDRTGAMVRDGRRFPPRDYKVKRPGRETTVEVSSVVIDYDGGPAVLGFVRDVTETRRAQAELERTQRLAALGTLVAGVAHEVNNPLSFASMGAEMLNRYFASEARDEESARAALSSVTAGLERITLLVRELRSFVRSEQTELVALDLGKVIAAAVRITTPLLRKSARVEADLPPLPCVRGRASRLEQVFVNLLINAAQSFGVEAPAHDEARNVVQVHAVVEHGEVRVTVADNGAGIEHADLGRVFDPFYTTKMGEGTGLGLAIVHAIVAQHGGRVYIDSAVGEGTRVTVVLHPDEAAVAEPGRDDKAGPAEVAPARRARVLVVDDEPAVRQMLRKMLAPSCEVEVAADARAAMASLLAAGADYEAVLCDLTMPGTSGLALFERVRAERPEVARAFAFMTGGIFGADVLERAPDVPRLEKPFTAGELRAVLERVLG